VIPVSEAAPANSVDDIRSEIRRIVRSAAPAVRELTDDGSLFDHGAIDSLTFLAILGEIERRYALPLTASEVATADISSIQSIASLIVKRRDAVDRRAAALDGEPR
jgi:acyl carrier protein